MKDSPVPDPRSKFAITVGGITVRAYPRTSRGYQSWVIRYHRAGMLVSVVRASESAARAEAQSIAERLAAGEGAALRLSGPEASAAERCILMLRPLGVDLETAVREYAELRGQLPGVSIPSLVSEWLKRHPVGLGDKLPSEVADELCAALEKDGRSRVYLDSIRSCMKSFSERFNTPIASISGESIDDWLRSLPVSPRTRNNHRLLVSVVFNFAVRRGYLPRGWSEMERVSKAKEPPAKIEVFTPEEMQHMLEAAPSAYLPWLVFGGFAGLRTSEVRRLTWPDVSTTYIRLAGASTKTGMRRIVPITPNLLAWLADMRNDKGRVMSLGSPKSRSVVKYSGVPWKPNGLRHSYISYSIALTGDVARVASESGNTPAIIHEHYRQLVTEADAKRWFAIMPKNKTQVTKSCTNIIDLAQVLVNQALDAGY